MSDEDIRVLMVSQQQQGRPVRRWATQASLPSDGGSCSTGGNSPGPAFPSTVVTANMSLNGVPDCRTASRIWPKTHFEPAPKPERNPPDVWVPCNPFQAAADVQRPWAEHLGNGSPYALLHEAYAADMRADAAKQVSSAPFTPSCTSQAGVRFNDCDFQLD
jgi:hypothetical protein